MKKRRLAALALTAALVMGLGGCGTDSLSNSSQPTVTQEQGKYTPGIYTAIAKGNNGDVTVSVTFSANAIDAVEVGEHGETPSISAAAIDTIPGKIVEGQTLAVDTISGATNTSNAILNAVADCVKQAGGDPEALRKGGAQVPETAKESRTEELNTDVLIIGGGGAGMAAALEADNTGADVLIVEWMPFLGGDTGRAGGGIEAAGTSFQKANGVLNDTPKDFEDFILSRGITYRNPNLLKVMTQNSAAAVEFLADLGADMSVQVAGHGSPVDRAHRPVEGSAGQNVVQPMIAELERRGVSTLLGTRGVELLIENGAVVGAKAVNESEGIEYLIHAKSVVLATGNFASNNDMVAQYDPRLKGIGTNSSPGSQGDGIVMAVSAGADLENMDVIRVISNLPGAMTPFSVDNAIAISQDGVRFMDETNSTDTIFVPGDDAHIKAIEGRTEKFYWFLMDDLSKQAGESMGLLSDYMTQGNYVTAPTLEELAAQMGVSADMLTATVAEWNGYVVKGSDEAFGRASGMTAPVKNGPFWAVRVIPKVHNTAGGIRIDESARVLDKQEQPIAGLYAAGEVTGGVHDGVSAVCDAIVFGRIAGASAGTYAGD